MVAAEPAFTDYSTDLKRNMADNSKKGDPERPKKGQLAEVNAATAEVMEKAQRAVTSPGKSVPLTASSRRSLGARVHTRPGFARPSVTKPPRRGVWLFLL